MLVDYIMLAMRKARYELIAEGADQFYGEIPGFEGVYATSDTLEGCRDELQEVLEEWLLLRVARRLELPVVDGIKISVDPAA